MQKFSMEQRPIFDSAIRQDSNGELVRAASSPEAWPGTRPDTDQGSEALRFPAEDGGRSLSQMAQRDLLATLQLLAERAQYITGASGSAIALLDGDRMVCRASAGTSAPEVGALLQVNSGLSGESVRTRQTLRCDDAATDTRVNRESCEALGIASVVVMPLVQGDGVIGVFELFSDKPNVFEGRDITALERMGGMVFTALEQVAGGTSMNSSAGETARAREPMQQEASEVIQPPSHAGSGGIAFHMPVAKRTEVESGSEEPEDVLEIGNAGRSDITGVTAVDDAVLADVPVADHSLANHHTRDVGNNPGAHEVLAEIPAVHDPVTTVGEAGSDIEEVRREQSGLPVAKNELANLRKCESCGFPVSEGRHLCLDCEKKPARETGVTAVNGDHAASASSIGVVETIASPEVDRQDPPLFLGEQSAEVSWISSHKYMVGAIALAVAGIVALLFAH